MKTLVLREDIDQSDSSLRDFQRPIYKIQSDLKCIRKDSDYLLTHRYPFCNHCGKQLQKQGNPPSTFPCETHLDGNYNTDYHCYLHYLCYNELQIMLRNFNVRKEDLIMKEVDLARENGLITKAYYNPFSETSWKTCNYCNNVITNDIWGFRYPSDDKDTTYVDEFGFKYIHLVCYDKFSRKYKYGPAYNKNHTNDVKFVEVEEEYYDENVANRVESGVYVEGEEEEEEEETTEEEIIKDVEAMVEAKEEDKSIMI